VQRQAVHEPPGLRTRHGVEPRIVGLHDHGPGGVERSGQASLGSAEAAHHSPRIAESAARNRAIARGSYSRLGRRLRTRAA
jgi:hypothetical protein